MIVLNNRWSLAVLGAAVSSLLLVAAAAAESPLDRTIAVSNATRIVVSNTFGDIDIRGWDSERVRLEGTVGANNTLESSVIDNVLTIAVRPPEGHSEQQAVPSHLILHVPRAAHVDVRSVMAAVTVGDLAGPLDVSSSTGTITADVTSPAVNVSSVTGKVMVSDPASGASVALRSTSGPVEVSGVSGALTWTSISGSLLADKCAPTRVDLRSTAGRIELRCSIRKDANYQVSSKYGPIVFHPGASPDARFVLATKYGSIHTQFASSPDAPNLKVSRFTVGRGDATVNMETESGRIVLE